jgi:leucyl aminopeptidase
MKFRTKTGRPELQRTACVAVGIFESGTLSGAAERLDKASGGRISTVLRGGDLKGETGQTLMLHDLPNSQATRVLLVGCGKQQGFNDQAYRKATAAAAGAMQHSGADEAVSYLPEIPLPGRDNPWKIRQAVITTEDALYVYDRTKTEDKRPEHPVTRLAFMFSQRKTIAGGEQALAQGSAIATGMTLAKDLANLPGNICTPSYLAEQAMALKKGKRRLRAQVLDEAEMEKLGMGALLSVSRGSEQPARLISLEYRGVDKGVKPVVLVGKGITFDTGGISIKPSEAMDEMKFDMCGAASVLGTLQACADMGLAINVVGIIAAAENMPSGRASRPGDIVTTLSGKTVEILNTDAEGRLVLCDALSYARRFDPQVVIDIATLTGACIIALGHHPSGLLANEDGLADALLAAGETSGDRVWRLPLWDDYQEQLKSNFADLANIGGRPAGTITAACFLSRFTEDYHWAHLDIAGTAWRSGKEKGATGRPVALLTQYLLDRTGPS